LRQSTRTSIATGCPLKGSIRGVPLNKAFLRVFWSKCSPVAQTACHRERQHEKVSLVRDERRFCRFLFQSSSVILRGKQSLYVFLDKTLIILRKIDIIESVDSCSLLVGGHAYMQCNAKLMLLTMSLVCSALVCFIDTWIIYIDNRVFIILIWWSKWTLLSIRSGGRGVAIMTGRVTHLTYQYFSNL
jgi:hypothetical protein